MNKAKVFQGYKYIITNKDGRTEYINSLRDLDDFRNKYQNTFAGSTIDFYCEENKLYKVALCKSKRLEDIMLMRQMDPSNREYNTYLNEEEINDKLLNKEVIFVLGLGEIKNVEELY